MPLSREDAQHVALLCRIALSEEELQRLQEQISSILEQFEVLKGLDTDEVPASSHSVALVTVMRQDTPQDSFPKEEVLTNAPQREEDFFRVLPILEEA